jgi:4-alpha-glucanotransferase
MAPRSSAPDPLLARARRLGIQPEYEAATGGMVRSPRETIEALAGALAEPGAVMPARLDAAVRRCHPPPRTWGWTVQLYALRSARDWGIGDLADLAALGRRLARGGAGFVMTSPLHASLPVPPRRDSPYFPSTRRFLEPLHLRIEEIPGFRLLATELEPLVRAGRALNRSPLIDRDAVHRLKLAALERLWRAFPESASAPERAAFQAHLAAAGEPLQTYARFCAAAEREPRGWRRWPSRWHTPAGLRRSADAALAERAELHAWLQWLADRQLAAAARAVPLVQDLAVGVDPSGADAWEWQDILIPGFHVGAPPDAFSGRGQSWGFPAFDPAKLTAARLAPMAEVFRAGMRHSAGLRIDHVMALFRLWLIPDGADPGAGVYLTYPAPALLDLLADSSRDARTWVVGEDLGTVAPEVRRRLGARGVLSYRLAWFEQRPPSRFPRRAMAALTTHDLPTVAGLWTGDDLREQRGLGLDVEAEAVAELRARLARLVGAEPGGEADLSLEAVIERAHAALAEAPSTVLAATLEDALGLPWRPNIPGAPGSRPNWRRRLPVAVERLDRVALLPAIAGALRSRRPEGGEAG